MRYKRVVLNTFLCICAYGCGKLFMWAMLRCLPYYWDGAVELDYIHPLVMDKVDDYSKAYDMEQSVRILCWTLIEKENRENYRHVAVTWGQKCSRMVYISDGMLSIGTLLLENR